MARDLMAELLAEEPFSRMERLQTILDELGEDGEELTGSPFNLGEDDLELARLWNIVDLEAVAADATMILYDLSGSIDVPLVVRYGENYYEIALHGWDGDDEHTASVDLARIRRTSPEEIKARLDLAEKDLGEMRAILG